MSVSHRPAAEAESWRVVVVTTAAGAYRALDDVLTSCGHRIVAVLTTPGPPSRRDDGYLEVVAAAGPDVGVIVSSRPAEWAAPVRAAKPDLLICLGFPLRLPDDVLALARLGAINGHNSLLPAYRGPNPQGWVFRNGEPATGFTIHRMITEFDAGPTLAQAAVDIDDDDDIDTLGAKVRALLPDLFVAALERIARADVGEPQDATLASAAPFFEPKWRCVDWSRPARTIHNQVRSLFELPGWRAGAVAAVRGRAITILKTQLVDGARSPGVQQFDPGDVIDDHDGVLVVQCGDKPLRIVRWIESATR